MMLEPPDQPQPAKPRTRKHRWVPLLGLSLALLIALGLSLSSVFEPLWNHPYLSRAQGELKYRQLRAMQHEVAALIADRVSDAEWQACAARLSPRLKQMSQELGQTASRKRPAQQNLLWTARDRFPQLIAAGPQGNPQIEAEIQSNLDQAGALLDVP